MGTVNEDSIGVKQKQKRYILFVGNLPYGITKKQITTFFKALGNRKKKEHFTYFVRCH
jgi:RNA recognition motif-containing protein